MNTETTESIFAENILLLGAGFTKNFGGLLANEMWVEIFNHEKIQAQPRIKKLMLNNFDYESVYYSVLSQEGLKDKDDLLSPIVFTNEEKDAIKIATKAAYDFIDDILVQHNATNDLPNWIQNVNKLLVQFGKTKNNGFIFTLNQDLFIERFYRNPDLNRNCRFPEARLSIPGINKYPGWFMNMHIHRSYEKRFESEAELKRFYEVKDGNDDAYCTLPNEDELNSKRDSLLKEGSYFLIKLHGSYNWKSSDGSDVMVIGRGKKEKIQSEPLLKYYFEIFDKVLSQSQCRLLIIGYGFGDQHINSVISKAITYHGLKVYILSPESPEKFREKLCEGHEKSDDTINIWRGISGYFQCVDDVLLKYVYGNQSVKEHFYNVFFGRNNW